MSYQDSGFDSFLSRSIDDTPQFNLDSQGPQTTQMRYDSAGLSGVAGDVFRTTDSSQSGAMKGETVLEGSLRVGNILIDGDAGNIKMADTSTNRLILGQLPDGTINLVISRPGVDINGAF